jgi:hypothetical protein
MTKKDKIITLAVVGFVCAITLTFVIATAWTLSIIFGH